MYMYRLCIYMYYCIVLCIICICIYCMFVYVCSSVEERLCRTLELKITNQIKYDALVQIDCSIRVYYVLVKWHYVSNEV